MENDYQDKELYKMAQKRIKEIKGFYIHLLGYVLVNIFIFVINSSLFKTGTINIDFGSLSLPFFWGIGVAAHCASVFGPNLFLGKDWEEKKIKQILDKEKQERNQWE